MNERAFAHLVTQALDDLPEEIAGHLDNVEVVVERHPTGSQLAAARVSRGHTLFGLYEGVPRTARTTHYGLVLPDKITIFQQPIEASCRSQEEMRDVVRRTVVHEIAHHFGLDDDTLHRLGY